MPRLFTGIQMPPDVQTRLSLLSAPLSGAKWVAAENLHLTLRFLGDVDDRTADEFLDAIAPYTIEPFELTLTGLGVFGSGRPDVIWIGAEPKAPLQRLHQWHERAARQAGLPPSEHGFVPHVTLARLRGTKPYEVAQFMQERGLVTLPPFRVTRLAVFSSRPGTGGGPYAVEEAITLTNGNED